MQRWLVFLSARARLCASYSLAEVNWLDGALMHQ